MFFFSLVVWRSPLHFLNCLSRLENLAQKNALLNFSLLFGKEQHRLWLFFVILYFYPSACSNKKNPIKILECLFLPSSSPIASLSSLCLAFSVRFGTEVISHNFSLTKNQSVKQQIWRDHLRHNGEVSKQLTLPSRASPNAYFSANRYSSAA